jgi:ribosome-associated translation inhibitor RaiA
LVHEGKESAMLVQIRTDNHVQASDQLNAYIERSLNNAIGRFSDRVTRIEAYLKDDNSLKGGPSDKECTLEARLKGLQPLAVSHSAPSLQLAADGAMDKLVRAIERAAARSDKPAGTPPASSE